MRPRRSLLEGKHKVGQPPFFDHYSAAEIGRFGAQHGTGAALGNFVLVGAHRFVGGADVRQPIGPSLKALRSTT
jgi:hypothetical protein